MKTQEEIKAMDETKGQKEVMLIEEINMIISCESEFENIKDMLPKRIAKKKVIKLT